MGWMIDADCLRVDAGREVMWRETPYVIIGAHEPGRENKWLVGGPSDLLQHNWQVAICERDPDSGACGQVHVRIVFTEPELMRKFAETLIETADRWEEEYS